MIAETPAMTQSAMMTFQLRVGYRGASLRRMPTARAQNRLKTNIFFARRL